MDIRQRGRSGKRWAIAHGDMARRIYEANEAEVSGAFLRHSRNFQRATKRTPVMIFSSIGLPSICEGWKVQLPRASVTIEFTSGSGVFFTDNCSSFPSAVRIPAITIILPAQAVTSPGTFASVCRIWWSNG